MYYYVYDEYIQEPKYAKELSLIETRLTDLGIAGKIARLALFRDPTELIRDEVKKGAKTIIAIGNDFTLRTVLDAVIDLDVTIGVIPLGPVNQDMARILGIPIGAESCEVAAARITEKLDAGTVNGKYFLHKLIIPHCDFAEIVCDASFKITIDDRKRIEIRNVSLEEVNGKLASPLNGKLELVIQSAAKRWMRAKSKLATLVPFEKLFLQADREVEFLLDGQEFTAQEFKIKVIPKKVQVITGKGRLFQ